MTPRRSDDERDADHDGLNNYIESHGPGKASWWAARLAKERPRPGRAPTRSDYDYYGRVQPAPVRGRRRWTTRTCDGDSLLDGEDDQDNDDMDQLAGDVDRGGHPGGPAQHNPFNPCAPTPQLAHLPAVLPL